MLPRSRQPVHASPPDSESDEEHPARDLSSQEEIPDDSDGDSEDDLVRNLRKVT